ncbi:hypothetical protein AALP_AAs74122U000200 [Arabis alpina]|uniref:RING-type E3 ubiquitin transferase n=1 Tax=Arabis alpina TaxID=50452 RepID=A0A087FXJ0_ARAAL|nr:hypothetical protein AALP_AAs74122U000200 [Arabis alpina]
MFEVAAFACVGVGFLLSVSSRNNKFTTDLLELATRVTSLKELVVVVHGTVGSTSTVENTLLGVFVEETASVKLERMHEIGSATEYRSKTLNRKQVPWYLDDGTARVYVTDYQYARGFYYTLQKYVSTEPVIKDFEHFVSDKEIKFPDYRLSKCQRVLEIGTSLTVIGNAVRDKDGTPTIRHVYEVLDGHIELNRLASDLKIKTVRCENYSLFLTTMGMVFLGVHLLQRD